MEEYRKFGTTDLFMLMAIVLWAINFSFVKIALLELSPLGFNGIRLFIASLTLILILLLRGETLSIPRSRFWMILGISLVGNTIYQMLFIHGINLTTASNTSVIMSMTPVSVALIASLFKQEKISRAGWIGILGAIVGFYLVIFRDVANFSLSKQGIIGDLLILGGNLCWSFYTVLARPIMDKMTPLKLTTLTLSIGTLFYLPFTIKDIQQISWAAVSWKAWAALLFSAVFAIALCFVIWYASVKRVGNSKTAIYGYMTPVFAVLFASFILNERLALIQIVGALIIFSGVYLTRSGYRYFEKSKETKQTA